MTGHFTTCVRCGGTHSTEDPCEAAADRRIGTVVDKYRIVRLLGCGGMGSVYEAQHVTLRRRFAIKFMLQEYAANRETLRRFENEAKAAGGLEHANIAAVTDIGQTLDGSPYLVMEYLTGLDGSKLLARFGPLPVPRATNIVFQTCLGLAVAHKANIVHRDIKPENLLVTDAGDGTDLVKILDFGIAKLRSPDASVATTSGMMMGTVFYMSPEQIRDAAKVDPRTDVWALGVVLYELLTGRKPFHGTEATEILYRIVHEPHRPMQELRSGIPPELVAVIDQALEKDVDRRLPSVAALARALAPFANRPSGRPAKPSATTTATRSAAASPTESVRRRRRPFLVIAAVLVLLVGATVLALVRSIDTSKSSDLSTPTSGSSEPAPSNSESSTSDKVRTLSEQAGRGSDNDRPNTIRDSNPAPPVMPTNKRAANTSDGSPQSRGKIAKQPNSPISIDTSSPY